MSLEVCIPELGTKRDKTGLRLETIPKLPGPGRYYKCLVLLLGTIREKFGKNLGRYGTAHYHTLPLLHTHTPMQTARVLHHIEKISNIYFNSLNFPFIRGTRAIKAQFQIKAPDPYPLHKRRTDLGTLMVLSAIDSVTRI